MRDDSWLMPAPAPTRAARRRQARLARTRHALVTVGVAAASAVLITGTTGPLAGEAVTPPQSARADDATRAAEVRTNQLHSKPHRPLVLVHGQAKRASERTVAITKAVQAAERAAQVDAGATEDDLIDPAVVDDLRDATRALVEQLQSAKPVLVAPEVSAPTPTAAPLPDSGESADLAATLAVAEYVASKDDVDTLPPAATIEVPNATEPINVPRAFVVAGDISPDAYTFLIRDSEVSAALTVAAAAVESAAARVETARAEAKAEAEEFAARVQAAKDAENGRIPLDVLCTLSWLPDWHLLRCDAAAALEKLNEAYRAEFGADLAVTDTYRTYELQVITKEKKGDLAATPGRSNHGWGVAVDFAGFGALGQFDDPDYLWMKVHAERFGWRHPTGMEPGGGGPYEPWHWEYGTEP